MENKIIVLLTDFGNDVYVGQMKGVIKNINLNAEIIDLTHEIQPQNILQATLILYSSLKFFSKGSIFVCIVDPGVGSSRDIILLSTEEHLFLAPNNGILTSVIKKYKKYSVFKVANSQYFLHPTSNTFHGRDIFAPVAAYLSKGVPVEKICVKYDKSNLHFLKNINPVLRILNGKKVLVGKYVYHDRFGNIATNLTSQQVRDTNGIIKIFYEKNEIQQLQLKKYYSQVKEGEMIAYINSFGFIEIAINKGNAFNYLISKYNDIKKLSFCVML